MKVKELKELLANYDDDLDVLVAADPEGNSFQPLGALGEYYYTKVRGRNRVETIWNDLKELVDEEGFDYNCIDGRQILPCLIAWP